MKTYEIVEGNDKQALSRALQKHGQLLLPLVQMIETAETAVDHVIDVAGRATVEAVLQLSAQRIAGTKHQGKAGGDIRWYGEQSGRIELAQRKLHVKKPRLRRKGVKHGEVEIPAYVRMRDNPTLASTIMGILLRGVSTRNYQAVLPEMAETLGESKSAVSREFIEASAVALQQLQERRFDDVDLLVIYIDGQRFGKYVAVAAMGVDLQGQKHVLGVREGATENAEVVKGLLEDLVSRGVKPGRRRLFIIDGAKALRNAIDEVYGQDNPVQRCRRHKERNVVGQLPKEDQAAMRKVLKAAWRLPAAEGQKRLEQEAQRWEKRLPSVAGSLREGLAEMFTVNRLDLPDELTRCLCSTNVIEATFSGTRSRTQRVRNWQSGEMVLRWTASSLLETEKASRRIMGYKKLWMLESALQIPWQTEDPLQRGKTG